jgi:hypothetical protein
MVYFEIVIIFQDEKQNLLKYVYFLKFIFTQIWFLKNVTY